MHRSCRSLLGSCLASFESWAGPVHCAHLVSAQKGQPVVEQQTLDEAEVLLCLVGQTEVLLCPGGQATIDEAGVLPCLEGRTEALLFLGGLPKELVQLDWFDYQRDEKELKIAGQRVWQG